ncbi:hypothetical protein ACF0H5_005342 [Mactra antiquata]
MHLSCKLGERMITYTVPLCMVYTVNDQQRSKGRILRNGHKNQLRLYAMLIATLVILVHTSGIPHSMIRYWSCKQSRDCCDEKHNIVFLKVHKTGSSTVANVLQRYGLYKDLIFALPNKTTRQLRFNYFGGIGETLDSSGIKSSKRHAEDYNILYNHVIFNDSAFLSKFPKMDFMYVTMLRDPTTQFLSSLQYFLHENISKAACENISAYLTNPAVFEPTNPYLSFTDNRQALDLGLSPTKVRDLDAIISHIMMLDEIFDLVLITEYFDESLIILKRRMCWQLKDIIYLRKNMAYKSLNITINDKDEKNLKMWNLADHYFYQYFRDKFIGILTQERNLTEEVQNYRRILNDTRIFCTSRSRRSHLDIEQTIWNPSFTVTSLDCAYMRIGELKFHTKLLWQSNVQ